MFEDSMIESQKVLRTGHRGAATILSFLLQAAAIGILVLIPLLVTEAIPKPELLTQLQAPPPPAPPPPPPAAASASRRPTPVQSKAVEPLKPDQIRVPSKIPKKIEMAQASAPPPPSIGGVAGGVPGGVAGGQLGGVVGGVLGAMPQAAPKIASPKRVRVSQGVAQGLLVHKVVPQYPATAKAARIQGSVVLQALIGKDGSIQNVQVVSGPPQLAQAALEAVKQWKYKPYFLNGQAVEVQTMINVNFSLGGSES